MTIGLLGVAFVLHLQTGVFHFALVVALFSAVFRALSSIFVRQVSKFDKTITIVFYYFLVGTIVSGLSLFFNIKHFAHLPWTFLLLIALFGGFYQMFLMLGYKLAPIRLVSPFIYSSVVYAAIADWFIWHQSLSLMAVIGIVLVFIGATLTIYFGHKNI